MKVNGIESLDWSCACDVRLLPDDVVGPVCICGKCTCDGVKNLSSHYQMEYIMSFLMGLHDSFSQIRSQLLLMDPLPPINKVFALISQEEQQRKIGNQSNSTSDSANSLAFTIKNDNTKKIAKNLTPYKPRNYSIGGNRSNYTGAYKGQNKERPFCTHCNFHGHTIEKCYKDINSKKMIGKGKKFDNLYILDATTLKTDAANSNDDDATLKIVHDKSAPIIAVSENNQSASISTLGLSNSIPNTYGITQQAEFLSPSLEVPIRSFGLRSPRRLKPCSSLKETKKQQTLQKAPNNAPLPQSLKTFLNLNPKGDDNNDADADDDGGGTALKGTLLAGLLLVGVVGGFGSLGYIYKDQINDFLTQFSGFIEGI
ncbi:hypothetical protein Acr_21g0003070 [Actinidia rufa]|uniref:Uncharacterized protein n=1 Tax=Actinidia rufa TaxID=165716 RepID=A0A7J0GG72_9ERIC|nr:hypothetical protein Acr_21g0003070 [Actinidia rufa]